MGLTFSSLFKQLFGMRDMRILMVGECKQIVKMSHLICTYTFSFNSHTSKVISYISM